MGALDRLLAELLPAATCRLDLWVNFSKRTGARAVAEIGVWKGEFAEHLLRHCDLIQRYYMIDPWSRLPDWNKPFNVDDQTFDDIYAQAMARTGFAASRIVVLRGRTREVIDSIPDESLDFAYIDGDHTLRGITIDLAKVLPKIRKGGFIGGDDFVSNPWQHGMRYEPTLVCPYSVYFSEAMDLPVAALPFNQFLIHRDPASSFRFVDCTGRYGDLSLNRPVPAGHCGLWQRLGRILRELRGKT